MSDRETEADQWRIIQFGKKVFHFAFNSAVAPILTLVVLIAGGLIGYVIDVVFNAPLDNDASISIGIWIFLSFIGGVLSILALWNFLEIRSKLSELDLLFEGIDNRFIFSIHVFIYGFFISGFITLIMYVGVEFSQLLNSQVQSDPELSDNQVKVATTVLQTLGLLIPIWIGLINFGVRKYFDSSTQEKREHSISVHNFISVGSIGYALLVISWALTVWVLLPIMPRMIANGMYILITGLAIVGIHFITLDRNMEKTKNESDSPPYLQ